MMKWISACLLFAVAAPAGAAGHDVEDLLLHMRNAYKMVKSATFTATSHIGASEFVNSFSFKSPSKIRLEITSPKTPAFKSPLIKVSDGASIWMKLPNAPSATRMSYSIDNFENSLPVNLECFCFWDYDRQLSTARGKNMEHSTFKIFKDQPWNGKNWIVLEETASQQKIVVKYYVDPKSSLIWRTVVRADGSAKDTEDSQITKMDTAAHVADSLFTKPK